MWEMIKSIVVSVITVFVTVQLSLRRFRTEKWWERKSESYSKIVEALHGLKNYYEQELHVFAENEHLNYLSIEEKKTYGASTTVLLRQYQTATSELAKAIDVGSFVISDEAVKILETYQSRPQLDRDTNSLFDVFNQNLKYVKECLQNFKIVAKKDMGFK